MFAKPLYLIDNFFIHEAEISCIERNIYRREFLERSVKKFCSYFLEEGIFSRPSFCIDNIISFAPFFYHLRDNFRAILEICVHDYDSIPFCVIHPSRDGDLMSEVSRKIEYHDIFIFFCEFFENWKRVILWSVIYKNEFIWKFMKRFNNPLIELIYRPRFIIDGEDIGYFHRLEWFDISTGTDFRDFSDEEIKIFSYSPELSLYNIWNFVTRLNIIESVT